MENTTWELILCVMIYPLSPSLFILHFSISFSLYCLPFFSSSPSSSSLFPHFCPSLSPSFYRFLCFLVFHYGCQYLFKTVLTHTVILLPLAFLTLALNHTLQYEEKYNTLEQAATSVHPSNLSGDSRFLIFISTNEPTPLQCVFAIV